MSKKILLIIILIIIVVLGYLVWKKGYFTRSDNDNSITIDSVQDVGGTTQGGGGGRD